MNIKYRRLLAKSSKSPNDPQRGETLAGHSQDVVKTAKSIVDAVGERVLRAMALPEKLLPDLQMATRLAAIAHDIGKAADSFQAAVRNRRSRQALRHEWISAWLLIAPQGEALQQWLFSSVSDELRSYVIAAVLGHHRKATPFGFDPRPGGGLSEIVVLCDHPDFFAFLKDSSDAVFSQFQPGQLVNIRLNIISGSPLEELTEWTNNAELSEELSEEHPSRLSPRFVALVKAILTAADVAGSAVIDKAGDWVADSLENLCSEKNITEIVRHALGRNSPRDFQNKLAKIPSGGVGVVTAGCGSGKTIGAYMWAQQQATKRKLFFCYPTTGTATEGFRDYALEFAKEDSATARLLHSRSAADLRYIQTNSEGDDDDKQILISQKLMKSSISAWDSRLIVCTAHQVLGLMQNHLGGLCLLPAIANSAVVFDEIHLFDDRMFAVLLDFLDTFPDTPTLLMTASLQNYRRGQLRQRLDRRLYEVGGPPDWESAPRYRFYPPQDSIPWERVKSALRECRKVLIVANTVGRVVQIWDEANEQCGELVNRIYCYHSRFKYRCRRERHREVVDALKRNATGPALAVTTQVCEVSLDISADLLVSELAPIPAMIQRLGRLNRVNDPRPDAEAHFVRPEKSLPYGEQDYGDWRDLAEKWVARLATADAVSQTVHDLVHPAPPFRVADMTAEFLKLAQTPESSPPVKTEWLCGGAFTSPGLLTESSNSVAVVMEEDESTCRNTDGKIAYANLIENEIPMFAGEMAPQIREWRRLSHAFIAPSGRVEYSPDTGASWSGQRHLIL